MSNSEPVHLVVGADGLVGGALVRRLRNSGVPVAATTRRRTGVDERLLHLDLAGIGGEWKAPWPVGVATVCAAATKLQACKEDPVSTAAVNVEGIPKLVAALVAAGAFVIIISSNQVFDGSVPRQQVDAPASPILEYGRQKAEMEKRMAPFGDSVAIVRFTKIFGSGPSLLTGWARALAAGEPIRPFSDMTMAPIPLSCAVTALTLVAQLRIPGVTQVSGQEDISYADAALLGATAMGADPQLVQPVAAGSAYPDPIPVHTSLNVDRMRNTLGIVPPAVRWTVETAFTNPELLSGV